MVTAGFRAPGENSTPCFSPCPAPAPIMTYDSGSSGPSLMSAICPRRTILPFTTFTTACLTSSFEEKKLFSLREKALLSFVMSAIQEALFWEERAWITSAASRPRLPRASCLRLTLSCRLRPPFMKVSLIPGICFISSRSLAATCLSCMLLYPSPQRVRQTMGTSSMEWSLSRGLLHPGGIQSKWE